VSEEPLKDEEFNLDAISLAKEAGGNAGRDAVFRAVRDGPLVKLFAGRFETLCFSGAVVVEEGVTERSLEWSA